MKKLGGLLLACLLLVACGSPNDSQNTSRGGTPPALQSPVPSASPSNINLRGTLTVSTGIFEARYDICPLGEGYSDIRDGAQVTVSDAGGTALALGELGPGQAANPYVDTDGKTYADGCKFDFRIAVPDGGQIYGIEVAHRGVVRMQRSEMDSPVALTLGS